MWVKSIDSFNLFFFKYNAERREQRCLFETNDLFYMNFVQMTCLVLR